MPTETPDDLSVFPELDDDDRAVALAVLNSIPEMWMTAETRSRAELDAAIARAEAAEASRDALLAVARAARAVGVFDQKTVRLAQALDSLPPELRAMVGQPPD